jgi:ArsR family transcriptional regulator, arsenate/arsenite/antimonite-responsive transcriptional repressor
MLRIQAQAREAAVTFRALSDPTRIQILRRLAADGEVFQKKLVHEMGRKQPSVSRHLAYLKRVKLVLERREGRFVYLRIGSLPEAARELLRILTVASEAVVSVAMTNLTCYAA